MWFVKLGNHEFVSLYIYAILRSFETVLVFFKGRLGFLLINKVRVSTFDVTAGIFVVFNFAING